MTIEKLVESVLLRLTGYDPSTDSSIMRVDIRAMLPVAINYAMDKTYNITSQSEGDRDMASEFYGVFEDIPINTSRPVPFIELSKGVVPLKGNAGIRFVYNDRGEMYSPLSDADLANVRYYMNLAPCSKWFRRRGNSLDLYGVDGEEELHYQAITSVDDLDDTDEAPISAGQEVDVVSFLAEWFGNKTPSEGFINTKDDTNQI